jgi:hypothetical protein
VAHNVYGVPQTINSASYVVVKVFSDALDLRRLMQVVDGPSAVIPVTPEQIITGN